MLMKKMYVTKDLQIALVFAVALCVHKKFLKKEIKRRRDTKKGDFLRFFSLGAGTTSAFLFPFRVTGAP